MIEEGKTGFFTDPYDEKNIAEAVGRILADDELTFFMSKSAKQVAKKRFMASAVCEQTLKVYKEILAEKAS